MFKTEEIAFSYLAVSEKVCTFKRFLIAGRKNEVFHMKCCNYWLETLPKAEEA